MVLLFILMAVFAPFIAPYSYEYIDFDNPQINKPPSLEHPFGTDSLGRDLFSRVIYGSRVSIAIGFVTGLVALVIGV
ncbi:MAG: peptide ABC transporter permease, partial [Brevinematales bacterium]